MCQSTPEWNIRVKHPSRAVWPWNPGTDAEETRVILAVILAPLGKHSRVFSLVPLLTAIMEINKNNSVDKLRPTVIHIQKEWPKLTNNGLTTAKFQWHFIGNGFSVANLEHYSVCFTQKIEGSSHSRKTVTDSSMGEWEDGRHSVLGSVLGDHPNPKGGLPITEPLLWENNFRGFCQGHCGVHATAKVKQ